MDKKLSDKELETMVTDIELFRLLLPLFEKMSKRGQDATISTLIRFYIEEV